VKRHPVVHALAATTLAFGLQTGLALAEDPALEPDLTTEMPKFADRELLIDTLLRNSPSDPDEAEAFEAEVRDLVENEYTDEQVVALNRALNNTLNNGIVPLLGSEELQRIVDEDFNSKQIHEFVKAYREEAKFLAKAERFEEGSKQYTKAVEKAEKQKGKFLGKVERFADAEPVASDGDGLSDATKVAEKEARAQAKAAAKASASDAALGAGKKPAKAEAKQAQKLAKELAKEGRKKASKDLKGKNKDKSKNR
jgi:hypothetical protein